MNFWEFCEKISVCVGEELVVRHCDLIYRMRKENKTVDGVVECIKMTYPAKYFWKYEKVS